MQPTILGDFVDDLSRSREPGGVRGEARRPGLARPRGRAGALARSILRPSAGEPKAGCASRRPPESLRPAPCEPPAPGQNRPAGLPVALARAVAPARHAAAAFLVVFAALLAVSTTAQAQTTGICGRTAAVRTAILGKISGVSNCASVTDAHLADITGRLNLHNKGITALAAGDFAGLTALTRLDLAQNSLTTLPAGVFDELTALTYLDLAYNSLTSLPAGVFDELTALTFLYLYNNSLSTLPDDVFEELTALTFLWLQSNDLGTLRAGVFDELTALTYLRLENNRLTTLPAGVFDELTALTLLYLYNNSLTTLPAGVFDELTALTQLQLLGNSLSTLPAGVFDELTALTGLRLDHNSLSTLPAGVFDELTSLTSLYLFDNQLATLPAGVFEELTSLTDLRLQGNPGAPFSPTAVALPDDGEVSFAGGDVTLDGSDGGPWGTNVTYSWALTSPTSGVTVTFDDAASASPVVTIPALAEGTELTFTLTVTGRANRTARDTDAATVTAVFDPTAGIICGRTEQVRDAIVGLVSGVTHCANVTDAHLADITGPLNLSNKGITALAAGDFDGLTALTQLQLFGNSLSTLPDSVFDELTALGGLHLGGNDLSTLPDRVFDELTALTTLKLNDNSLTSLPADVFDELTELEDLALDGNSLTTLPVDVFNGLTSLGLLSLSDNSLSTLPANVFAGLTALGGLYLGGNDLTTLPAGVFDGLTALVELGLNENELTTLDADVFNDQTALLALSLFDNALSTLPAGVFDGLTALTELYLFDNALSTLPDSVFDGLTALRWLDLGVNSLGTLPAGVFDELTALGRLELQDNPGAPFSPTAVALPDDGEVPSPGGTATLDGSGSGGGPWGTNLTYSWALTSPTSGVTVTFDDNTSATPVVTVPALAAGTELTFTLTVTGRATNTSYGTAAATDAAIVTAVASTAGICGRTQQVRDELLDLIEDNEGATVFCADVTDAHLAAIPDTLSLARKGITALAAGDFAGLSGVTLLNLLSNDLTTLPDGVFDGLTALTALYLLGNSLTTLPDDVFDGLTALTGLSLSQNSLATLPAGVFNDLTALEALALNDNSLATLPAGVFDGLTALRGVELSSNSLTTLPAGVFDGLTALTELQLYNNSLTTLSAGVFDKLTALTELDLGENSLTTLPAGVFDELTALTTLLLQRNPGAPFSPTAVALPDDGTVSNAGGTVTLDGSGSDGGPWGTNVTYSWAASGAAVTFDDAASVTPVVTIPALAAGTELTFTLTVTGRATDASYGTAPDTDTAKVTVFGGICGRTAAVRTAILDEIPGVSDCADVTDAHLAAITGTLDLLTKGITALAAGDFDGLTALTVLDLFDNSLTTLPAGVFDNLTALTVLWLAYNSLTTLPAGVFDDLTALTGLVMNNNELSTLPAGVFDKLTALTALRLFDNSLTTLPAGVFDNLTALTELHLYDNQLATLPANVFDGLTSLTSLRLYNNQLTSLPTGVFDNLTALTDLQLHDNQLATLPANVFDELTALTTLLLQRNPGAPFSPTAVALPDDGTVLDAGGDVTLDGSGSGGAWGTNVTYSWRQTSGPTTGVTFDDAASATPVVTIPALAAGTELTFTLTVTGRATDTSRGTAPDTDIATVTAVFDATAGICGRTEVVRDAIVALISGVSNCALVTDAHLAAITGLYMDRQGITALAAGDFDGLTALGNLDLQANSLSTLPAGVFDELTALRILWLHNNSLTTLPAGVFDELTSLTQLYLGGNELTTLPAGVFDGLTTLTSLLLTGSNELTELPTGVFDDLTSLTNLVMHSNGLTSLPTGVFDNLTALTRLSLNDNSLSTLPAGVFDKLTALTTLSLNNNSLTTLPAGVFEPLTALTTLNLQGNPGAPFSPTADALPDDGTVPVAGGTVTLDGSGSDGGPWGTNVTYSWAASGAAVTFDDAASATPVVTIPALADGTELTFTLTVTGRATDTSRGTAPDTDNATVTAPATNAAPAFTSSATVDAAENQTAAGTVEASDSDAGDSVTGYAIQGGADRSKFSIGAATGVLTFTSAPNFEDATDDDASNTYVVVVRATSGTGERLKTADQTITVTVTDVDGEAPGVPAAPTVSSASVSSVTAAWAAPANAGPPITDYDYRYRVKSTPGWTEVTNTTSTALGATIAGLAEDTEYEVQVRATNAEGTGGWSDPPGSGSTDANAAPAFTTPATFDAAENQTAVGTVVASDSDAGDSVTGYAIQGGADRSKFSIGAASGVLTFTSAPNFEAATDADTDNDYVVVVRATSGTGARAKTEDQTITVTVTDEAGEAPGVPAAPTVSAASVSSVTAAWAAPANAGPPITDYDYRYRVKSTPGWTEVTNTTITALSATITGLAEDTEYEVQVRATNDEGTSGWSDPGSASTDANAAPAFTSSATFSAAENQTAAGTVEATDSDTGDSVTGYEIQGGADRSKFSIGAASGVLTFRSAPNFEDATDDDASNTYEVVVRATSGTGERLKTEDQTITVTVTDEDGEAPGVPAAPTVSSASVSSVTAAWAAPANAGPPITDYDYRYRVKTPQGSWTEVTNTTSTALGATIAGLAEDTEYEVQVRATNAEGTGGWSDPPGSGSTDANAAPSFTTPATFDAAENQTAVGTVVASDSDTGDSVTGYAIQGGADRSKFSIGAASGVLTFTSAPNFEAATDADTDNDYVVVVRATSGTGERLKTADQTITVTVTDEAGEAPGAPATPTVSSASVSSVTAAWAAPANAGPPITDYDYRYRVKTPQGSWTEVTNTTSTALGATITGLAEDTEYEVQVRATNAEGTSDWSDPPGSGSTDANAAPAFTSSATVDAAENQTAAGTVEASDSDAGDSVTGYAIQGGADRSKFSIGAATGVLTFTSAPNFEDATDDDASNTYEVVVRATSGTGERLKTADQTITVTVTDEAGEAPGAPATPTVSSASVSSVTAAWAAPANAGPPITDYDYRYRVKTPQGSWTEVTNTTSTALGATIAGLAEDTEYEVQVRATNAEGTSGWSDPPGSGSTDANAAPAFTTPATFDAAENQTAVGTVVASDSDAGDSVTGYAIQGGADRSKFSIGAASGVLTFTSAPNFEAATDADTDNDYVVVVRATSGTGERLKTADQTITVTVTDEAGEAPGAPATPTVSSASVSSVTVTWAAPANAGPPITDYDYRYRVKTPQGSWTEVTNTTSTALSATITGLAEDTEYEVQVRATNAEGTSDWSDPPGSGSTDANAAPAFTSSATVDAAENQTAAGTVEASDSDAGDSVTGYAIQGGADRSKFSIGAATGVLTFTSAPNFEAATDDDASNTYVVVVRATSGTGERLKTADQTITVTDEAGEAPGAPATPTVSSASVSSVTVTWAAPANAGPPITDYDYRYRVKTPQGSWTEVTNTTITALGATIAGLAEDTEYEVQVRATNAEGTGGWSDPPGSGSTDANAAPAFTSSATFDAAENQTAAGTVVASDSDAGDSVTGYAIQGGADRSKFSIGAASGVLTFTSAPNFEAATDADTDNDYVVVVRATSGTGARAKTADQTITVTVTDVDGEAPGVPAAPTVSAASVSSLTAAWAAPANAGPPITDYDYRYRVKSTPGWTEVTNTTITALSATITGLAEDTEYEVQVRATNDEGTSGWSDPGSASTDANAAPAFTSSATFSAAENQTAAGTVEATDSDTGDSVTGYEIQGGADRSKFSIGAASGVLTFRSAPNFEDATDDDASNTYEVVVRATSGTGARAKTEDQTITVTVTDVDGEAPGVPAAPTVSSASVSSVTAAWAAPANAGPPITDYDYRYRVKTPQGSWTEVTNTTITALSATITGLAEDTEYEVQVRATNDEGTSGWSDPGSASTDANAAPAFTSSATFSAAENQTAAGTVEASDSDTGDSVTGYAIQGGADQSAFSIGAASGVLTFRSAPNFEDATDDDASNTYVVVVRATSGTGERLKTADQTITVTVTDEAGEGPGAPATPTVSSASVSSVTVTWAAPANAGPPITDYDYRYRVKTPQGSWTEVTNTPITALRATITGLAEDTEYEVQVRATNAEGTSDWSDPPGSGSTDANAAPAFTSSATVDAAENQTVAGTVAASDSDAGDSVTGYAIQGGADQSAFSIGAASGVLTFRSAPNFEDATDDDASNTYVVVVRATSGTGERLKTADQTITVTVTDEAGEAPGAPATPTVSSASVSSVTAAWAAPANAGPPITDYDYRYQVKSTAPGWTEVTNTTITALSATIAGLAEDTEYEVQVRATNAEGTSGWSDPPGSGSTDANAAPSFTTPATFDAAENQTAVGTVVASDSDAGDSVTGYAIQGGADRSKFSIGAASGVLTFTSAPNFEAATDADTDNDYVVVVRATSGTGERLKTADQTITVTVTDEAGEAPGAPATPTVSSASVSSVTAAWAAPANAGPPITDYDYRYRVKTPQGSWTEVTNTTSTALRATIAGLAEDTEYEVQVRATNAEGTSDWSDPPGSGSTDANAAPAFTSSATFSAAENQTAAGTVVASDSDAGDSVTGYAIQGGADRSKFSIGAATGVLTFTSAPNFEAATDDDASNTYEVVVRATSGTGERLKTADQTITVTVTDEAGEAPGAPATPTVSSASVSSVTVTWAAPANAGPPITDYDYRYRVKTPQGSWTEVTNTTSTALGATIAGLAEDTEYEVQVRATNAEGTGGWSDPPGSGSTDANAAPAFTTPATFDAAENQTAVGTVVASDSDAGDSVTGYAIQGGADRSKFSIGAASGVLTFTSAPNFEAATDADTDNDYVVVVRATSGTGERLKTADQTITVTVTDVDGEAPGVPAAPTVSSASVSSVTAAWAAPANAGPPITDYDYRYRVKTPQGSWTEVTNTTITALSATITGLAEDTEYEVQVRATNAEGTSDWSDPPGSGSTDANAAPAFTSSATFSAAENQTAAGTVEASDSDAGDSVTGYEIQGGADQSAFSIGAASGVLTFTSAPNFEDATDDDASNTYVVVVRATSGTGARAKTADQTITVTVTDVDDEAPGVPAAPTVASASVSSVTAAWAAPANAGPPITDYDYRYRVKSTPGWTEVTNTTITALSATITELAEDTEYEVQVRATNDEGTSGWSDPGSASTDANAAPAFTSSATFSAAENQTAAGTVEASDSDTGDSVTGYEIQGGADRSKFSIGAASGVLTFRSAPNFEDATDADASNTYEVVVRATSGTGARAKTADQTITVTVTDVDDEAPGVPAAPTVSSASVSSVTAAWAAPANAGPPITDYDYRYRVKSTPGWTEVTNTTITALSATITGLAEDTEYEVQVRATNDEGTSGWSDPGSASTDANAAPAFTSSATFSAAENQTAAGTVAASDSDTGDSVTGYAIQGGADRSKFSIGAASGVLTFTSAPNFEDATDDDASNTYEVVVRATSGTGARAKTADQTITVTVTDVDDEAPGVPAAPTVSSASVSSVTAAWAAPANAGPPITDYDYRYQVKSTPGWTEVTNTTITALSATITGLAEDTEYEVQVRATNDEGTSGWSDSGSASTDANAAPAFTSSATFDAAENQTAAGTVEATDSDAGDSVTGYEIQGGADQAAFSIGAASGVLTFRSAPNFEDATDDDASNTYEVVVRATSGTGTRASTADQTITVTVTDVDGEAPGVPAAPTVSSASVSSVTAAWAAPANAGPPITDYDYRYRVKSTPGWTEVTNTTITALSATIAGLADGTEYEVQVRATNDEGTSGWSDPGSASPDANAAPAFTSSATFSAAENQTAAGTVEASDSDAGDSVTGYAIQGGADRSKFSIGAASGVLTFRSAPNFEDATDADASNTYEVVVRATSGTGARAKTADQTITVTVTDVDGEAPGVPAAPTVSSASVSSVTAAWAAPANAGPPITDYDYRYRVKSTPGWTEVTNTTSTALSATITGLAEDTEYEVQVRATNDEGTSGWSDSGSASTDANAAPAFTSSATFDAAENQTAAGTVEASDSDTGDSVTGYAIQGGADRSKFSIGAASGVLTFRSAPNFEDATDDDASNTYVVVVRATSGTGARAKTADQTITVTVTDVDGEAPGVPAAPTVSSASVSSVTAAWAAPANAGPPITDYDYRYRVKSTPGWTEVTNTTITALSATITGLAEDTEYEVQVRATNDEGTSGWSDSGSASAATTPGVTVSKTALTVTEDDTAGDSYTVVLDSRPTADVTVTVAGHSGTAVTPDPTTLTFTASNWDTAQTVTVTAGDDADTANESVSLTHSAASTDSEYQGITITGVAVTVTDLAQVLGVGVVPGNAQLVVTWTAVDNATGYTVQWMSGGQGSNTGDRQAPVTPGSTTSYTIPGLTNGTEYTVRVIATRTGASDGPPSAEVKGTPFTTPGAPQHLSGVPGDEQVMLTWDATSSDGGSAILRYEYAIDDSGTWIDAGLDLEETVPGLTNGRQYAFEVRAVNSAGPGAPARTAATPLGMPSVPASLTTTAGDGEVFLEWTAPADDGGAPVTGYEYRFAAGTAVPEDTPWQSAGLNLEWTVTGLTNGQQYAFEVRALNSAGPGAAATPVRLEAELFSSAAAEGEPLVVGVRRSGGLTFPAHAYIGVTDSALPGVTATEEGRDDGLGRHRLEFAAGAAEATVTVTVAFDGERRQDRVLSATLDSAELEVDGVRRPYELVTPTLVVPVTEGDAGLSVADARVEGKSSVLAFTVSLDRTRDVAVRVDYATEDGSARAGEDYTPVSGTLTIEAGGRERTVEVPVLPALHVTGERTLTLRLSSAVSAVIDDGVATGVIVRESELPKAWLARFGRTASDHAAQAIARRLEAGQRETQVTVAGRRVDGLSVDGLLSGALPSGGWRPASAVEDMATRLAAPALAASGAPFGGVDADPGTPGLRAGTWGGAPGALDREPFADAGQTLRRAVLPDFGFRLPGAEEALMGTSFYVERGAQQDVGGGKTWAAWGDVAATRFEGDAGGHAIDGDVVTGTAGLDRRWRALLVGLALSRSSGEGGYGTGAATIASTLTSVHPYMQVRLGERAQVWGAAGWGRGGLEITPGSGAMLEADLRNSMAAAGARAVLMGAGGLEIALRSDFLWTETASDGTAALAEAVGTASRGRLMLEGAGQIQGLGGVVRPKVEGGVRYDGGDAETGRGFEVGGGLDWARGSLTLQVNGRMLVAHADESYEEWGYSGSLVYEPGADGLGLQMRVGSSGGVAASGIRNLWALENASGLVRGGAVPFARRFDAEVGYGIGRGTLWYPYFVADDSGQTRYGLKLSSGRTMGVGLEFGRRESVDLGPQDAMLLRGELRF